MKLVPLLICVATSYASKAQTFETSAKVYRGQINKYPITLKLTNRFGQLTGHYYYDKYSGGEPISLYGKKNGNNIILKEEIYAAEDTLQAETFTGHFINDSTIMGEWQKPAKANLSFTVKEQKIPSAKPKDAKKLRDYVGLNTWNSGFFEQSFIQQQLKAVLDTDYQSYLNFLGYSGCYPEFQHDGNILFQDFSVSHIGPVLQSLFVVDLNYDRLYICWIKDTRNDINLYPRNKPIPEHIMKFFVDKLNLGWGHAYEFSIKGNSIINKDK